MGEKDTGRKNLHLKHKARQILDLRSQNTMVYNVY